MRKLLVLNLILMEGSKRKLAAIMFTDIVGYSALMSNHEERALEILGKNRRIHSREIKKYRGTFLKEIGDGILASFETVTDAVCCAATIQKSCEEDRDLQLRIGIHQGEVLFEKGDVFGEGVNIASRIEGITPPGSIYVSRTVYQNLSNKREIQLDFVKDVQLKNISFPVGIYEAHVIDASYLNHMASRVLSPSHPNKRRNRIRWIAGFVIMLLTAGWFLIQKEGLIPDVLFADSAVGNNRNRVPVGIDLPKGPRIAVLPFRNLSDDQEQKYFTDGLSEDIITALSRTDLFVLGFSPNLHEISERSISDVGQELGVRYLLKGSVRRDSHRIRISAQLFDASSEKQVWGESYSRDLTVSNIFDIQDDITARVVSTIADANGVIIRKSLEELERNPTQELEVYECVLRTYVYEGTHTAEAHLAARECVEAALEIDSTYADLLGIAAYLYREENYHNFNKRPGAQANALRYAKKAIEIDPLNQNAHYALAFTYFDLGTTSLKDFFMAAQRAIELNPNNSRVIGGLGVLIAIAGEWNWGIDLIEKTMSINPYSHIEGWRHFTKAANYYRLGEYKRALDEIKQSPFTMPIAFIIEIASEAKVNNQKNAIAVLERALAVHPSLTEDASAQIHHFFLQDKILHDELLSGVRQAESWMRNS